MPRIHGVYAFDVLFVVVAFLTLHALVCPKEIIFVSRVLLKEGFVYCASFFATVLAQA